MRFQWGMVFSLFWIQHRPKKIQISISVTILVEDYEITRKARSCKITRLHDVLCLLALFYWFMGLSVCINSSKIDEKVRRLCWQNLVAAETTETV